MIVRLGKIVDRPSTKPLRDALRSLHLEDAVQAVLSEKGQTLESVLGTSRTAGVTAARQWLMLVMREATKWSYPVIGALFHRDHSTVLASVKLPKTRRYAPIPEPYVPPEEQRSDRERIAAFLQKRADQLHAIRGGKGTALEVEELAGIIRRGEDRL